MECNLNESGVVILKVERNQDDIVDNNYFEESTDHLKNTSSRDCSVELKTEEVFIKEEDIDSVINEAKPNIELIETLQNNHHNETYDAATACFAMGVKKEEDEDENSPNFRVDRTLIESISKENQASELCNLEGLTVYDQELLEAGIMRQVDQALDEAVGEPSCSQSESNDVETDMERQIRLGEMTPFGSTMDTPATATRKNTDGLKEIDKYLRKQLELQKKGKNKNLSRQKMVVTDKQYKSSKTMDKKGKPARVKKKVVQLVGKKRKNDQDLSADSEFFNEKLGQVAREPSSTSPRDSSGSEYVPSESDFVAPSSDDERRSSKSKKTGKKALSRTKRQLNKDNLYKIPEDWASDDSDWEYSDEEGNFKKNKRSKKELDDGDVDSYIQRIHHWERKMHQSGEDQAKKQFHEIGDGFKLPKHIWDKLYNYQRVGVRWLRELDQQRCGGILGDEMGLGKTIQVIAFLAGLHISDLQDQDTRCRGLGPTLIVCPTTVMHQWVREFHQWYPPVRVGILHESGTFCGKQRNRLISNMVQASGVLITSYTGATMHKDEIITRRWHYVVLDEGHKIRNPDAQITLVVKQLRTAHRLILSGSPMQNNLKELWSLFDFVFPGKLGTLPVFLEHFSVPITQGGYANASQVQVATAFKCATVLKDTIAPYLLRRMKADVKCHISLPDKNEQVLFCRLTDEQRALYRGYVSSGDVDRILEGRLKIFVGLINLRKICNHPDLYPSGKSQSEEGYGHWSKAGKMIVVETLLKLWHKQGHRVLMFTQSRQMLLIMEAFVRDANYSYLKLDGNVSIAARQPLINKFNQDTSYFVMLLTTRVGGLGVNLTGANRVLIYDPDWNPATDTQARERAWRIGQQRAVTVYRLITAGTIEEKMYHRQIFKQFLCNKVLKDPRQRRFFKSNDLFELFTLKETDVEGSTETAAIFAGTNSEVKLDPTKKYKHRRVEPKLSAERPLETYARKKAEKAKKNQDKKSKKTIEKESQVQFSVDKIERMKKLAQLLSQKCVEVASSVNTTMGKFTEEVAPTVREESSTAEKGITPSQDINEIKILRQNINMGKTDDVVNNNIEKRKQLNISKPSTSSPDKIEGVSDKHREKHQNKKKKRYKDAKFEGEKVPYLVKAGTSKDVNQNLDNSNYATQDEYVLQKLFAKSGLQTAMKHDTIMEGGPADYALVEGEADRVAKQALDKLQQSGRECWRAESGVPTFTGTNGARNFQPSKKGLQVGKTTLGSISSSELLQRIRQRNGTVDATDRELELARDMRSYIVSYGGTVNTDRLINRFEGRLEEGSSPLFKSLLSKMCTFYRAPDHLGYWTLKEEFNW